MDKKHYVHDCKGEKFLKLRNVDIPVGTTHALLLKDGKVAVSGPVEQVITSQHVSAVFGIQMEVTTSNGRFYARAI